MRRQCALGLLCCVFPATGHTEIATRGIAEISNHEKLQALTAAEMGRLGHIHLVGYHEGSTAGGGDFAWRADESADNLVPDGGMVIAPAGHTDCKAGCLVRRLDGYPTPEMWGALGNWKHDDTAALNAATAAVSVNWPAVSFARGQAAALRLSCRAGYIVRGSGWNLTSARKAGQSNHDGLTVIGCGPSTQIIGETGPLAAIDVSGSQWLQLRNLWVFVPVGTPNGSCVGIFDGISVANPQSQNQLFDHVRIALDTNLDCNEGLGTVGIWDFGAEEDTWKDFYVSADTPLLFTGENDGKTLPAYPAHVPYPYAKLQPQHSLGMTTFQGSSFATTIADQSRSVMVLDGVNSFDYGNLYLNSASRQREAAAISLVGLPSYSVRGTGTIEGPGTWLSVSSIITNSDLRVTMGGVNGPDQRTASLIRIGPNGVIQNSDVNASYGANFNRPLFAGPGEAKCSCGLQNSRFTSNLGSEPMWLPSGVLLAHTASTQILGFAQGRPVSYRIDSSAQQSLTLDSGTAEGSHGLAAHALLRIAFPGAPASATGAVRAVLSGNLAGEFGSSGPAFATGVTATVTALAKKAQAGCAMQVNVESDGLLQAASAAKLNQVFHCGWANGRNLDVTLVPAAAHALQFQGTATLFWSGERSASPHLELLPEK